MAKRGKVSVRWDKKAERWLVMDGYVFLVARRVKQDAEDYARARCRERWMLYGVASELYLYNRDGKLGKGSRSRSTYGNDPRRTKG